MSATACRLHNFFVYLSLDLSVWILVAVSVDRCLYVSWPASARRWCTLANARVVVSVIFCLSALVNVHFFWTYDVESFDTHQIYANGNRKCYADTNSSLTVSFIENIWPWIDFCIYCLCPFLFMATSNSIIIKQLVRTDRNMALYHKVLVEGARRGAPHEGEGQRSRARSSLNMTSQRCSPGSRLRSDINVKDDNLAVTSKQDSLELYAPAKGRREVAIVDVQELATVDVTNVRNVKAGALMAPAQGQGQQPTCTVTLFAHDQSEGVRPDERWSSVASPRPAPEGVEETQAVAPKCASDRLTCSQEPANCRACPQSGHCRLDVHLQETTSSSQGHHFYATEERETNLDSKTFKRSDYSLSFGDSEAWSITTISEICSTTTTEEFTSMWQARLDAGETTTLPAPNCRGTNNQQYTLSMADNSGTGTDNSDLDNRAISNSRSLGDAVSSAVGMPRLCENVANQFTQIRGGRSSELALESAGTSSHSLNVLLTLTNMATQTKVTSTASKVAITSSKRASLPAKRASSSSKGASSSTKEASASTKEASASSKEASASSKEASASSKEASASSKEASASSKEASASTKEASASSKEASASSKEASASSKEASASSKEASASSKEASASSKEASASSKEASASTKEASASSKDASASTKEASASTKEASAPSKDASASSKEASASSNINRWVTSLTTERQTSTTSRRNTSSVSKTLLAITIMFWVFNAPIVIFIIGHTYFSAGAAGRDQASIILGWTFVNILQYLNNALHFFLYCLTGPKFRQELKDMFREWIGFAKRSISRGSTE